MGSGRVNGTQADNGHAAGGMSPPACASQSAAELVTELSQLEYQLRAWSGREAPGRDQRGDVDLTSLRVRKQEVRTELQGRGLDFPDASGDRTAPSQDDSSPGKPGSEPDGELPDTAALLAGRVERLERALVSRAVIEQAKGILMERHDVTAAEAFDTLRRISSVSNRKLRDIADELVETKILPGVVPLGSGTSGPR